MGYRIRPLTAAMAVAFSSAALWHGTAAAETKAATPALDDVVVSASRLTPAEPNASGLDSTRLMPMRASTSDTASLLRDIPGLSLNGAGGVSSLPAIHGLADDRLRIKVDGMDLISACANHMNSPLSYIDPSNVERVKVFAGITPVSVGGDSIGGTILVQSKAPRFAEAGQGLLTGGELGGFYRSNGNARGVNAAATLATENVSLSYSGSTAESDNYTAAKSFKPGAQATGTTAGSHWIPGDEVGSSAYKSRNQSLGVALRHDNHLLDFKLGYQDIPYQGFPNQRMDMTGNESTQANLRYTGKYDWGNLEARVYNEKTRHKMQFGEDKQYWYPNSAPGMPMDTEGKNTGALIKAEIALSARDLLRVGSEYQQYRLNDWWDRSGNGGMSPDTFWNIRDGKRNRFDLFGEWEAQWSPQWQTQIGARSSTVSMDTGPVQGYNTLATYATDVRNFNASDRKKTDHNVDLTALARFTPNAGQTYEAGYAQKTRSPNLYERYAWSTGGMAMRMVNFAGDGNGYVGNLDLKPEVAHTLSFTADWHDGGRESWGVKLTPYVTYVKDYIDAALCTTANCRASNATPGFRYLQFVNQDARLIGADLSGFVPIASSAGWGSLSARGMLNYVDGKNQTTGDNLYNIMPLNFKLALEHRLGNWTNTVENQLVRGKHQVSDVRNEVETKGYGLLNLRSSYQWKQVRVDLGLENALDKHYALPLGGAYVGQGATMMGGTNGVPYGIPVPGMGRSFYAGLNLKF